MLHLLQIPGLLGMNRCSTMQQCGTIAKTNENISQGALCSNTLLSQAQKNNGNDAPSPDRTKTDESGDSEQESDNST